MSIQTSFIKHQEVLIKFCDLFFYQNLISLSKLMLLLLPSFLQNSLRRDWFAVLSAVDDGILTSSDNFPYSFILSICFYLFL